MLRYDVSGWSGASGVKSWEAHNRWLVGSDSYGGTHGCTLEKRTGCMAFFALLIRYEQWDSVVFMIIRY